MKISHKRTVSFTRDELFKEYPELAKAYDELLVSDTKKFRKQYVEYCGKYLTKSGQPRRSTLGTIIETLTDNGYKVDIKVSKK